MSARSPVINMKNRSFTLTAEVDKRGATPRAFEFTGTLDQVTIEVT